MNCEICNSIEYLVRFQEPVTNDIIEKEFQSRNYCIGCIKNTLVKLFGKNYLEVFIELNRLDDAHKEYFIAKDDFEFKVKELITKKNGKSFAKDFFGEN